MTESRQYSFDPLAGYIVSAVRRLHTSFLPRRERPDRHIIHHLTIVDPIVTRKKLN